MVAIIFVATSWLIIQAISEQERNAATDSITKIAVHSQRWDGIIDENWSGLYGDTFKAVFDPLGIELEIAITPFKASIMHVQNKDCDVAMASYRNQHPGVLYPRWPHELDKAVAVHSKSIAYSSEQDLLGKKLAWIGGYRFDEYLPKGIDFIEVETEVQGLRMLDQGRIDILLDYEPIILKAAEDGGVDLSRIKFSSVAALTKPVYPIFRDDKRGQEIMAIYDRRMAELYANGTLDQLFKKYDRGSYPPPGRK